MFDSLLKCLTSGRYRLNYIYSCDYIETSTPRLSKKLLKFKPQVYSYIGSLLKCLTSHRYRLNFIDSFPIVKEGNPNDRPSKNFKFITSSRDTRPNIKTDTCKSRKSTTHGTNRKDGGLLKALLGAHGEESTPHKNTHRKTLRN